MEGDLVKSNIQLVKAYFRKHFPNFKLVSENCHGPFWNVQHAFRESKIVVSGDIGFSIEIFIDEVKFALWQYDRSVNNAMETSDENITYQLTVLKRFFEDGGSEANSK